MPVEKIIYETSLDYNSIISSLESIIEPYNFLGFSIYGKPYNGTINMNSFKIKRHSMIIRNSFKPVIVGIVETNGVNNIIRVKMRLNVFIKIFLILLLGLLNIIIPIIQLIGTIYIEKELLISVLFYMLSGLLFSIIIFSIVTIFFKIESKITKKYFKELLKAEMMEEKRINILLKEII